MRALAFYTVRRRYFFESRLDRHQLLLDLILVLRNHPDLLLLHRVLLAGVLHAGGRARNKPSGTGGTPDAGGHGTAGTARFLSGKAGVPTPAS